MKGVSKQSPPGSFGTTWILQAVMKQQQHFLWKCWEQHTCSQQTATQDRQHFDTLLTYKSLS